MEITAKVEQMSELQSRSFTDSNNQTQTIEYLTMVLNNGLERIACETANGNQARTIKADGIKPGSEVRAVLITWCKTVKTGDGRDFMSNFTRIGAMKPVARENEAQVF